MIVHETNLARARLYLVLDAQVSSYETLFEIMKHAVQAGTDIVQLRDKAGSDADVLAFSKRCVEALQGRVPFIINDRAHLVEEAGADGVHLGQDDLSLDVARRMLPEGKIIGVSCQTLNQAKQAEQNGADYIGCGSVFKTQTKPKREPMAVDLLASVFKEVTIPVFAIGGITVSDMEKLRTMGVDRVAVTRAICLARDVQDATSAFCKALSHE